MKKQLITLILFLSISVQNRISAQTKDKVCYTTTERVVKNIPYEVDVNTLATHEILSTRIVTVQKSYTESLDNKDNYTTSYEYLYHKNYFPDWYLVPDETVIDETGITNYFTSTTTLYDGGWQGHNYEAEANNSEYIVDLKGTNPQKKYFTDYTYDEFQEYDWLRQEIIKNGILFQFIFNPPSTTQLEEWEQNGYTAVITGTHILITNSNISFEWDLVNNTVTTVLYEYSNVISKEIRYYEFNTEIGENLVKTVVKTEYLTLTTGDCAEEVTTTDYEFDSFCSELGLRNGTKPDKNNMEAKVFPNPANDRLTVTVDIPKNSKRMEVIIYDQMGSTVSRKILNAVEELSIDISTLQPGFYTIGLNVDNKFKSIPFVKQ